MAHKIRTICSICDKELAPRNGAPGDPAHIRYVDDERHSGCSRPSSIGKKPIRVGGYDPEKKRDTTGESVRALDGTGLTERPAPVV